MKRYTYVPFHVMARYGWRSMRSDATRNHEAILTCAIAALADSPQASMREIADISGTGRTTLYRHFPDREALIAEVYARVIAESEAITARVLAQPGDPVTVLADLGAELAGLGDRYRFLEAYVPSPRARDTEGSARLRAYITAAQAAGEVRGDLDDAWLLEAFVAIVSAGARQDAAHRAAQVGATVRGILAPA